VNTNNKMIFVKILVLLMAISLVSIKHVDARTPVTYICCYNYSLSDGVLLDGFEYNSLGGIQIDNFDNVSNWTAGGSLGYQIQNDTVNFKEGTQAIELTARYGDLSINNRGYIDKVINNNFSTAYNFGVWVYVYNVSTLDHITLYLTSNNWASFFYYQLYSPNFQPGWNKLIFDKNLFNTNTGANWNNIMTKVRFDIAPIDGQNTSVTFDDFRYNVNYDWILGGDNASLQNDTVNFKEGSQGLKLIVTNGSTAYIEKEINNNFSTTNNFAFWAYIDNASNFSYFDVYFTSDPTWNKFFHNDLIYQGVRSGWNRILLNKHDFTNIGNENWNNVMNRVSLRVYPVVGKNVNVTFDDLTYNVTGQRAKLMIGFDDGRISTYSSAFPILNRNNQSGISFVITSYVGSPGIMNLTNLRTLQSAGWDISSHTVDHVDLTQANDSILTYELNNSYDWLVNNGFQKTAGFIAYPYGTFNDAVLAKVEKRYLFGRSIAPQSVQQHFSADDNAIQYIQRTIDITNTTSVQSIKNNINDTINSRLLSILVFHNIVDSNPSIYDYLSTDLQNVSNYIKSRSSDIDVITYDNYTIPIINNFTPVINKTTRIYSNGTSVLMTNNQYDEYMPSMTVIPSYDSIYIGITQYNESNGSVKFNESSPNSSLQVSYNIGDRFPNQLYSVNIYWANGTIYQNFNTYADNFGYIHYNSTGFGDSRYQDIEVQVIDTSFSVTLPIGYTYLRFNATNSTVNNLNPDGQNSSQPFFNITNNGNVNQRFNLNLSNTVNNIITYADLSNNFSVGKIEINTSSATIIPSMNPGTSQNIWMIIDAKNAPVTNTNVTLMMNSGSNP
jgi:peptidoglycan/xylan/chitin deacetylase (PgdA/CDA1 family)